MQFSELDKLIGVLEQERKVYEDILDLSKNKTKVIVAGKVAELESIVKLEQSLIFQLRKLEDDREKFVTGVTKEMGVDSASLTISEILKVVKGEEANRLKACQSSMKKALDELQNTNELNSKLIQNSLEYIDFSINLFTAAGTLNNSYGNNGQSGGEKKRNLFDVKL